MDTEIEYCRDVKHRHGKNGRISSSCHTCGLPVQYGLKEQLRAEEAMRRDGRKKTAAIRQRGERVLGPLSDFVAAAQQIGGTPCKDRSYLFEPGTNEAIPNPRWLHRVEEARELCGGCLASFECLTYLLASVPDLEIGSFACGYVVTSISRSKALTPIDEFLAGSQVAAG